MIFPFVPSKMMPPSHSPISSSGNNSTGRFGLMPPSYQISSTTGKLVNGEIVFGTNQENASYPVGICAERVLLGNAATLFPNIAIDTIAITYDSKEVKSDHLISLCGMCRQSFLEYETRTHKSIRLILAGQEGEIYVVKTACYLLPFAFTSGELL